MPLDWFISVTAACFNLGLLIWGINVFFIAKESFGIVALLFGSFGLLTNYNAVKRYRNGYNSKNGWLYVHIGGMIGVPACDQANPLLIGERPKILDPELN